MTYDYEADLLLGGALVSFIIFYLVLLLVVYIISALIFYFTSKTNGYDDIAYFAWIPFVNAYLLFTFGSNKVTYDEIKKDATKWLIIYCVLIVLSFIPVIGILFTIANMVILIYFSYRLFYRWTGETGMAILFVILTFITSGIFYLIYGLIKMKKPFVVQ